MIVPSKLQQGDEIRIIAPSTSAKILGDTGIANAKARLEELGFVVTFGKHIYESDLFGSSSIESRIEDLHDAFKNPNVKAILTAIGGFSSNEILPYIDYTLVKKNPKILCGFSDITALATAITTKSGLITYSGPHFSTFHMEKGRSYHEHNFLKCLTYKEAYTVTPSSYWSDDEWYIDQEHRRFEQTTWKVFHEGEACGQVFGGNLCTLNLLQGTPYMPSGFDKKVLFIEDDYETRPQIFARDLTSLLQTIHNVQALIIGRFQRASKISDVEIESILRKIPSLQNIPIMYNTDFGHTQSMFTFPIGGTVKINTSSKMLDFWRF